MGGAKKKKATILMLAMVVLVIGYYSYLSYRNSNANSEQAVEASGEEMTPVQELIARADYKEYPVTPVQVVKYYNEITACYYNEQYSEEELSTLAQMAQKLCDPELVTNQTQEQYMAKLKEDIEVFRKGNITIYKSEVTPATDVDYFEHNGYECARLYCVYTLKSGTVYQTSKEVYILRRLDDGHWKIYGFDLVKPEATLEEGM